MAPLSLSGGWFRPLPVLLQQSLSRDCDVRFNFGSDLRVPLLLPFLYAVITTVENLPFCEMRTVLSLEYSNFKHGLHFLRVVLVSSLAERSVRERGMEHQALPQLTYRCQVE